MMTTGAYHPPWSSLLHPVTCEHTDCDRAATHERGGWRFCFGHWLLTVQWDQPRVTEVNAP